MTQLDDSGPPAYDATVPDPVQPSELPLGGEPSEDEIAGHFLWELASDYQYATDLHKWIVRDGYRWVPARDGVLPYITACVTATNLHLPCTPDTVLKWARQGYRGGVLQVFTTMGTSKLITRDDVKAYEMLARLQSPAGQARLATIMARRAPHGDGGEYECLAVRTDELDTEPHILWAGGVPVDLARSVHEPVLACWPDCDEPMDLTHPHMLSANYRPDIRVPTPLWDALCEAVFPDAAEREHALSALAHGLHGYPSSAAILARSATGTGKSFIASLLADLLGDYADTLSAATLFGRSGNSQFAFDEMGGARFVVMEEGQQADFASTQAFKAVVNPAPLVGARARHERHQRKVPARHTLMLCVNPSADLDYSDPAVVRRLVPAGFTGDPRKIAEIAAGYGTDSEKGLTAWQREAPGVLAQMIVRCARVLSEPKYYGTRADAPESVMARFDAVAAEADPFGRWFTERTCDGVPTPNDDLLEDYRQWCKEHHQDPVNETWFGRKMAERGVERARRTSSGRGWCIALR